MKLAIYKQGDHPGAWAATILDAKFGIQKRVPARGFTGWSDLLRYLQSECVSHVVSEIYLRPLKAEVKDNELL